MMKTRQERRAETRDRVHAAWVRSLANMSVKELECELAAMDERLELIPERHVHRISDMEHNLRVLRLAIDKAKSDPSLLANIFAEKQA